MGWCVMRIVITGIAGFVGFHVAQALRAAGHAVSGVDNLNDYYDPALKRGRLAALQEVGGALDFEPIDIADAPRFADFVTSRRPEVVIHLAAQAGVRYSLENPFAYAQSNLVGHLSVLEACRHADGLTHLIYASSSSVYGGNDIVPFSEEQRVDAPVSLYAATKRSGELMSAAYAKLYGLKQIGLRFFTVYGPWGRPDMAYWIFTEKILRGEPIRVFNHGDMRRDFTYVGDVVESIRRMAESAPVFDDPSRPHKLYNIGNHTPEPLLAMIETLETLLGRTAEKRLEPMQPGDVQQTFADVDRLAADYGFNPSTPLRDGLATFVDWYRSRADAAEDPARDVLQDVDQDDGA
ncbi:MAG: NAD-dependent epimerase/dehydratase family protein [Pseudomonadota bacterium]